jgi:hypothetical protein
VPVPVPDRTTVEKVEAGFEIVTPGRAVTRETTPVDGSV